MISVYRLYIVGLLLFMWICATHGQAGKIIDERFLFKEYDDITEQLVITHPALYRFISRDSLDALIADGRSKIHKSMDQLSFYKLVSPLFAAVSDGHSKILIGESLYEKIYEKKGIFPYKVWMDNEDRLFVIDTQLDESEIPLGSEITAINGVPVAQFINEAVKYVTYEHKSYRNSVISDNLNWLLALTLDYEDTLQIEINNSPSESLTVSLIPFKKWRRKIKRARKKSSKRLLEIENNEYKNLGDQIGYLKIHEFGSYDIARYIENIRTIFQQIKEEHISSLIIDVRDNSGGDPRYVEALIHSISNIPFCRTEMMYQLKKGRPNSYYRLLGNTGEGIVRFAANHMIYSGYEDAYREPITFDNEFNGDIYILVNEKSYSAAATLASVIQCYDLGIVVGEMTGGTRIFQAYGLTKNYPRSKFTSLVSSTMIYTACSGFEDKNGYLEGVVPDLVVTRKINDILASRDVQLDYILKLIQEGGYEKRYD